MDVYSPSHPTDQDMDIESDSLPTPEQDSHQNTLPTNNSYNDVVPLIFQSGNFGNIEACPLPTCTPDQSSDLTSNSQTISSNTVTDKSKQSKIISDSKFSDNNSSKHRSSVGHGNDSRRRSRSRPRRRDRSRSDYKNRKSGSKHRHERRRSRSRSSNRRRDSSRSRRSRSRNNDRRRSRSRNNDRRRSRSRTPPKVKRPSRFHSNNSHTAHMFKSSESENNTWNECNLNESANSVERSREFSSFKDDKIHYNLPSGVNDILSQSVQQSVVSNAAQWSNSAYGTSKFLQSANNINFGSNLNFNPAFGLLVNPVQTYPPNVLSYPNSIIPPNFMQPPPMLPNIPASLMPNNAFMSSQSQPATNVSLVMPLPNFQGDSVPPPPPLPPPPPPQSFGQQQQPQNPPVANLLETLMSKAGLPCTTLSDLTTSKSSSENNQALDNSPIKQINKLLSSAANSLLNQLTNDQKNSQNSVSPDSLPPPPPPPLPNQHLNDHPKIIFSDASSYPSFVPPPLPNIGTDFVDTSKETFNGESVVKNESRRPFENMNMEEVLAKRKRYDFATRREWQERIALEVKAVLKPAYLLRRISKDDYKEIMKKAVTKISRSGTSSIDTEKINIFVKLYIDKYHRLHKIKAQAAAKQVVK